MIFSISNPNNSEVTRDIIINIHALSFAVLWRNKIIPQR